MNFPIATRTTAFLSGLSLSVLAGILGLLKSLGLTSLNADSPELFPFVLVYFFGTGLFLVIGAGNFAPKELKTKIPLVYFPTNREGINFMLRVWGRMLVWFLGAVTGGALLLPFAYFVNGKI